MPDKSQINMGISIKLQYIRSIDYWGGKNLIMSKGTARTKRGNRKLGFVQQAEIMSLGILQKVA